MASIAKLSEPFPPDRVSWRVGATNKDRTKGLALAYIDARDVMARLDEVCGPAGWQNDYPHANGKTVCRIGILVSLTSKADGGFQENWIWKANGAGDTDVEAEKGALSDAFKRAAVMWGIGRYLYDVSSPWVEIEPMGKSVRIKDSELPKLQKLLQVSAPTSDAAILSRGLATELIKEMRALNTLPALHAWGNSETTKKRIGELMSADQERVRSDYSTNMTALKTRENATT